MTQVSRRTVTGLATAGLGLPLLAACGGDADSASDPGAGDGGGSGTLGSTADIEVGGGTIFADDNVVVTQPTEGEFKAFSSTCTHQGCSVESVSDGTIHCPCHNSLFSIEDGSVQGGPATSPLPEVAISIEGGSIVLS